MFQGSGSPATSLEFFGGVESEGRKWGFCWRFTGTKPMASPSTSTGQRHEGLSRPERFNVNGGWWITRIAQIHWNSSHKPLGFYHQLRCVCVTWKQWLVRNVERWVEFRLKGGGAVLFQQCSSVSSSPTLREVTKTNCGDCKGSVPAKCIN